MTLLPIIYTSLMIFSGFLLFVIIVSYISFRAKSRNTLPPHLRHIDTRVSRVIPQPVLVNNYGAVRHSPNLIKVSRPLAKNIELDRSRINNNYNNAVEMMRKRAGETKVFKENRSDEKYFQTYQKENKPSKMTHRSSPTSDRLVIMNNADRFQTNINNDILPDRRAQRYSDHSNINVLTFYSDRPENDFVALSTPQARINAM